MCAIGLFERLLMHHQRLDIPCVQRAQRNPLFCTIGTFGTAYLYRLTALPIPESFPSIEDKVSFHQTPLIRGGTTASAPGVTAIGEKKLRDWVTKMFAEVGIERENYDPLIHGLRHHVEQEMAKTSGLDGKAEAKEKFMGRAKTVQDKDYSMVILPPLVQVRPTQNVVAPRDALTCVWLLCYVGVTLRLYDHQRWNGYGGRGGANQSVALHMRRGER